MTYPPTVRLIPSKTRSQRGRALGGMTSSTPSTQRLPSRSMKNVRNGTAMRARAVSAAARAVEAPGRSRPNRPAMPPRS